MTAPILICYSGSRGEVGAIEIAAALLGPRPAVVLHVASPITVAESVAATYGVLPSSAFAEAIVASAALIARRGATLARSSGFDAEARGEVAAPTWSGIVDVADELDSPLIVVGSRGQSGVREMLRGSISHEVARRAGRPVMVVPRSNGAHVNKR
jgi:nucleotide-binding universal stress UspA family protein